MIDRKNIDKALQLESLELPPELHITKIDWERFEDSDGEESLEIYIVLDDKTSDEEIERAPIHAIKRTVVDSLARHDVALFPYFSFERESEHEAPVHEE